MTDHAWTNLGYVSLMAAIIGVIALVGVPGMDYADSDKVELIRLVRDVVMAAAGYAFARKVAQ